MHRALPYLCAIALAACGKGDPAPVPAGAGAPTASDGGGAPTASPTPTPTPSLTPSPSPSPTAIPTATPTGDGRSTLALEIDRTGARDDVTQVDLRLAGIAVWTDGEQPGPPTPHQPCDLARAEWYDVQPRVRLDLATRGTTPVARLETRRTGAVTEVRIFLRGTLDRLGRQYDVNGDELCVGADGEDVAVLRVHPATAVSLANGQDWRLTIPFDGRRQLRDDHVICPPPSSGPGSSGPGPDVFVPHECADPDDPADDENPGTRIRFQLPGEVTCAATPVP